MGTAQNKSWFVEASATWAEFNYFYTHNDAKYDLYDLYSVWFQNEDKSLLTVDADPYGAHQYSSWVWPLFMYQTKGASAIFQAFAGVEAVSSPAAFDGIIDAQLPFATHFREFAVRNLNEDVPGHPYKLWNEDPFAGDFPKDIPHLVKNVTTIDGQTHHPSADVQVLAAEYDNFDVNDHLNKLVTLDFSKLNNVQSLDIDVVAQRRSNQNWKHIPVKGTKFEFCPNLPVEDYDYLHVVLSNHAPATAPAANPIRTRRSPGATRSRLVARFAASTSRARAPRRQARGLRTTRATAAATCTGTSRPACRSVPRPRSIRSRGQRHRRQHDRFSRQRRFPDRKRIPRRRCGAPRTGHVPGVHLPCVAGRDPRERERVHEGAPRE